MSTGGYGRGLDFLKGQREQYKRSENSINSYWPSARWIGQFWWGTEPNDMIIPLIHPVEKKRRNGTTYSTDALCARHTFDDPVELCKYCVAGEKGPWYRTCAYVFMEKAYHLFPPEEGKGKDWKPVKRAGTEQTIWVQDLNEVQFFVMKDKVVDQVGSAYLGDPEDTDRKPTLFDRPFRIEVTGEKGTRADTLKPLDKKTMPDEVKAAFAAAPPLEETIEAKMGERKPAGPAGNGQLPTEDFGDPGPTEAPVDEGDLVTF